MLFCWDIRLLLTLSATIRKIEVLWKSLVAVSIANKRSELAVQVSGMEAIG